MIRIRKLQKKDYTQFLNLVTEFRKTSYRQDVSKKLLPLVRYKNLERQIKADIKRYMNMTPETVAFFVAAENDVLIGYIWGNVNKRRGRVLDKIGFIEDWFVKKEYRKKSIGRMLWAKLINWFRSKNCNGLELEAFPNNQSAIDIYHKFGFTDRTIRMIKKL